jgi:hypothetical protein
MGNPKMGLLDSLLDLAQAAAPIIGHGAPEAIALGSKIVETIDHAKDLFDGKIPVPLAQERDAIEAKVTAHVESTAAHLRG